MKTCLVIDWFNLLESLMILRHLVIMLFFLFTQRHVIWEMTQCELTLCLIPIWVGSNKIWYQSKILNKKVIEGQSVELLQTWRQFVCMDENKTELANLLTEMIIQKTKDLPEDYEMVTGDIFMLVGFYGISTFVGYLMPNPFLY